MNQEKQYYSLNFLGNGKNTLIHTRIWSKFKNNSLEYYTITKFWHHPKLFRCISCKLFINTSNLNIMDEIAGQQYTQITKSDKKIILLAFFYWFCQVTCKFYQLANQNLQKLFIIGLLQLDKCKKIIMNAYSIKINHK